MVVLYYSCGVFSIGKASVGVVLILRRHNPPYHLVVRPGAKASTRTPRETPMAHTQKLVNIADNH